MSMWELGVGGSMKAGDGRRLYIREYNNLSLGDRLSGSPGRPPMYSRPPAGGVTLTHVSHNFTH